MLIPAWQPRQQRELIHVIVLAMVAVAPVVLTRRTAVHSLTMLRV